MYAAYYYFSNLQQSSLTGRKQLIATGTQEEAALGLQAYNEVLSQSQVVPSGPEVAEIQGIMQRLVAVAPKVEADLAAQKGVKPHIDWGSFQWAVSVL